MSFREVNSSEHGEIAERRLSAEPDDELIEDGQEEVFSWTAVALGVVEDPLAMDPDSLDPGGPVH